MMRLLFSLVFGVFFLGANAQIVTKKLNLGGESKKPEMTSVKFEKLTHNFGTVQEGKIVKHTFKFKNTGESDFVIDRIWVSCDCTEPTFSSEPVPPGSSGEITVGFDSKDKIGVRENEVTIMSNVEYGEVVLKIKAIVE